MRLILFIAVLLIASGLSAQAQAPTDAISRQVLLLNTYATPSTDAVSRQVLLVNVETVPSRDAASRQVLVFLPPYTIPKAIAAARISGGFQSATPADMDRLNVEQASVSAHNLDMLDTTRILRMIVGLDR